MFSLLTSSGDLSEILSAAGQMMTWVISQMSAVISFIVDNPVVLLLFLMVICGFAVGMLMRIWRSVG